MCDADMGVGWGRREPRDNSRHKNNILGLVYAPFLPSANAPPPHPTPHPPRPPPAPPHLTQDLRLRRPPRTPAPRRPCRCHRIRRPPPRPRGRNAARADGDAARARGNATAAAYAAARWRQTDAQARRGRGDACRSGVAAAVHPRVAEAVSVKRCANVDRVYTYHPRLSVCMPVQPPVTTTVARPRGHHLPPRALCTIQLFLGPTYWSDRARLTTLHLQLDLVTCDVFRAWADACTWAAWRARHPELRTTTMEDVTVCPWPQLPLRLRTEQTKRLHTLKARLAETEMLEHTERAAWVRHLVEVEATTWACEAAILRTRVHGFT